MTEQVTLKAWMEEAGYTSSQLAQELDVSYDTVYKMSEGVRTITDGFRWRFAMRFGHNAAQRIADSPLPHSLEPS